MLALQLSVRHMTTSVIVYHLLTADFHNWPPKHWLTQPLQFGVDLLLHKLSVRVLSTSNYRNLPTLPPGAAPSHIYGRLRVLWPSVQPILSFVIGADTCHTRTLPWRFSLGLGNRLSATTAASVPGYLHVSLGTRPGDDHVLWERD